MNALRYNLVFYEDIKLQSFIQALANSKGKNISRFRYAYIKHDSDIIEATGEIKKLHFHLWLEFNEPVKSVFIDNQLQASGNDLSALAHQKTDRNFLAYLTHDTINSQLKAHYSLEDIVTNIPMEEFREMYYEALVKTNKPSREKQEVESIKMLAQIVQGNSDIISISSLMSYLIQSQQDDLLPYVVKRAYGLARTFNDMFQYNSVKKASSELKGVLNEKLDYAKEELRELKKLNERVHKQINRIERAERIEIANQRSNKNEE